MLLLRPQSFFFMVHAFIFLINYENFKAICASLLFAFISNLLSFIKKNKFLPFMKFVAHHNQSTSVATDISNAKGGETKKKANRNVFEKLCSRFFQRFKWNNEKQKKNSWLNKWIAAIYYCNNQVGNKRERKSLHFLLFCGQQQ